MPMAMAALATMSMKMLTLVVGNDTRLLSLLLAVSLTTADVDSSVIRTIAGAMEDVNCLED